MKSSLISCTRTHLHRHVALASTYPDANARWNKCKQKQRKRAGAAQEEERTSFSFTASTAALGRDGSIHIERFCCWLDGWECDGFSTDPGWAGSGSLSCRENGASPAPGSSGPSSRSLQAWFNSRLHKRSHYIIMAKGWQGSKFLCSAFQRAQTRARWRADSTRAAEQCRSPVLCPHVHKAWHIYEVGGGGHWSTAETGLSNHPVRPAPTPWPPPLLCVTDYSRKVKWQHWD